MFLTSPEPNSHCQPIPPAGPNSPQFTQIHSPQSLFANLMDVRLAVIFQDLHSLARKVNMSQSEKHALSAGDLHSTIFSAQHRLFKLQNTLDSVLDELILISMLAFLTTTFQVQGRRIKYPLAANRMRELCIRIKAKDLHPQSLEFWILMVGTIAFFDCGESWLQQKWKAEVNPETYKLPWDSIRQNLADFMWIGICNDENGKAVFDTMKQMVLGK